MSEGGNVAEENAVPGPERYSFIGQLRKRLADEMEGRVERLNASSLKAMVAYFEHHQMELAFELARERDPWLCAEIRGKIDQCFEMAADMFARLVPPPEEKPRKVEEDRHD